MTCTATVDGPGRHRQRGGRPRRHGRRRPDRGRRRRRGRDPHPRPESSPRPTTRRSRPSSCRMAPPPISRRRTKATTVTYTLDYTFSGDPVTNGSSPTSCPIGLTYVADSATSRRPVHVRRATTSTTRTLTWTAATVTASGTRHLPGQGRRGRRGARAAARPTSPPSTRIRPRPTSDTSESSSRDPGRRRDQRPDGSADGHPRAGRARAARAPACRSSWRCSAISSWPSGSSPRSRPRPAPEPPLGTFARSRSSDPSGDSAVGCVRPRLPHSCVATPSGVRSGRSTVQVGCLGRFWRVRLESRDRRLEARVDQLDRAVVARPDARRSSRRGRSPSGGGSGGRGRRRCGAPARRRPARRGARRPGTTGPGPNETSHSSVSPGRTRTSRSSARPQSPE